MQKRLKKQTDCGGKHLGCSTQETETGLQCGLSGSRVVQTATLHCGAQRGTASIGNGRCAAGKSNPYLSRKIYGFCRRCLSCFPECAASDGLGEAEEHHIRGIYI